MGASTVCWRMPSEAALLVGKAQGANLLRASIQLSLGQRVQRLSHGARCLAEWLMRDDSRQCAFDGQEIGLADIDRILIGILQPGDAMCEIIARVTDGAITPEMFDRYPPSLDDGEELIEAGGSAPPIVATPARVGDREAEIVARMDTLGSIGSGPVAEVWPHSEGFFVKLPGVIAAVDKGTAAGLHAALGKALGDDLIRASAPPGGGFGGMHGSLSG